ISGPALSPLAASARGGSLPGVKSHRATATAPAPVASREPAPPADSSAQAGVIENYGRLPLSFEPNRGQTDPAVRFLARGQGYTLWLTANEAVLALRRPAPKKPGALLRLKMVGASAAPQIAGQGQLEGKSNYLISNDRARWHTDIPTYREVRYTEVWPGVDMVWYGRQRQLEYDFIVRPGADPRQIRLAFEGADRLRLDRRGNLVAQTKAGELVQHAPVIYQESEQGRRTITGKYMLQGRSEVSFEVGTYDAGRPLVIDPQLIYSTYLGSTVKDIARGIAVNSNGEAFIAGETEFGASFPRITEFGGNIDSQSAFVTRLNAGGTSILYSTVIGGSIQFCDDNGCIGTIANAIAVTSDGKACITGRVGNDANNSSFPVTSNAFQDRGTRSNCVFIPCRGFDAFVTVLDAEGDDLVYSTYFGGSTVGPNSGLARANDTGRAIAVDTANHIYITGSTSSNNLPTRNAFQNSRQSSGDGTDAFIAVFNPAAANGNDTLLYASFLGGSGDDIGKGIAVDGSRNAYVAGSTASDDLDTKSPPGQALPPLRATFQGGSSDAFVARIDTESSGDASLTYLTYFGGSGLDRAEAIAVDSAQRAYITGATGSSA